MGMRSTLLSVVCLSLGLICSTFAITNTRPIIGVLSQPSDSSVLKYGSEFIAASYVKWVEEGGARVAPISYTLSESELKALFNGINGVAFPGGGVDFGNEPQYMNTINSLWNWAITANTNGDYFPVWGTCMGFQEICMLQSGNWSLLSYYNSENYTVPLNFTSIASASRMFSNAPNGIYNALATQPITMNNHQYGVSPQTFAATPSLFNFFDVLSSNVDRNGREFLSTLESKKYPIYATQWHPEKPLYEWNIHEVINHSTDSILANQYTSNFFVSECRKSGHSFGNVTAETNSLIYNYQPVYIYNIINDFELGYFLN
eukprot:TRINITY_DN0_c2_g1_i3.p1 TRINITY_DN0_c2_g1~~TRINITY_DN0_c2_g1_i3.p1  ORF type:complete len:317 (-),score=54.86 TRINITY_DN0_c2_g1_i3:74-1024(-)